MCDLFHISLLIPLFSARRHRTVYLANGAADQRDVEEKTTKKGTPRALSIVEDEPPSPAIHVSLRASLLHLSFHHR